MRKATGPKHQAIISLWLAVAMSATLTTYTSARTVSQTTSDPALQRLEREIARLSRGAYCRFDAGSAHQLGELLRAVAAYAAGGIKALADLSKKRSAGAQQLLAQLK